MSTPCEIPGVRPQVAVEMATPVTLSVAEDLAAIFPDEPRPLTETALQLAGRRNELTAVKPATQSRAGTLGAIAAAALLGVAAGAMIGHEPAPMRQDPQPVVQASAAATPAPSPAGRSPATQPPMQAAAAGAETPAPARLHRVVARHPPTRHPPGHNRRAARAHQVTTCRAPHCHAPSVTVADERLLRRAYDSAADAGVSQNVLADYHAQWVQLRRQAPDEPGQVAARYHQLTGELDSMAAGRLRSDHVAPDRPTASLDGGAQLAALDR
jgi:hypothetical protein